MSDNCDHCKPKEPHVCPVFVGCLSNRITHDEKLALDAALLLWDKYRWPLKVLAILGKFLLKYRKVGHG